MHEEKSGERACGIQRSQSLHCKEIDMPLSDRDLYVQLYNKKNSP